MRASDSITNLTDIWIIDLRPGFRAAEMPGRWISRLNQLKEMEQNLEVIFRKELRQEGLKPAMICNSELLAAEFRTFIWKFTERAEFFSKKWLMRPPVLYSIGSPNLEVY